VEPLDGNAIAGDLVEVFGSEMTAVNGRCRFCGTVSRFAELRVYMKAPGAVGRCPHCVSVVLVLTHVHGTVRSAASGFELLDL
jgi:phage FluMu protein Com